MTLMVIAYSTLADSAVCPRRKGEPGKMLKVKTRSPNDFIFSTLETTEASGRKTPYWDAATANAPSLVIDTKDESTPSALICALKTRKPKRRPCSRSRKWSKRNKKGRKRLPFCPPDEDDKDQMKSAASQSRVRRMAKSPRGKCV